MKTAARYLDDREVWWQEWPRAQKDHGTICISCHTNVPYAMVRSGLRRQLGESGMTAPEKTMMDSVEKRVAHWPDMETFYSDAKHGPGKTAESRSTEAVLNAIILASIDSRQGHLRPITRTAFDEAWALQEETGERRRMEVAELPLGPMGVGGIRIPGCGPSDGGGRERAR